MQAERPAKVPISKVRDMLPILSLPRAYRRHYIINPCSSSITKQLIVLTRKKVPRRTGRGRPRSCISKLCPASMAGQLRSLFRLFSGPIQPDPIYPQQQLRRTRCALQHCHQLLRVHPQPFQQALRLCQILLLQGLVLPGPVLP